MPAVRKPVSTETAVQSYGRVGVDSVLRADPHALPAHQEMVRGDQPRSQVVPIRPRHDPVSSIVITRLAQREEEGRLASLGPADGPGIRSGPRGPLR